MMLFDLGDIPAERGPVFKRDFPVKAHPMENCEYPVCKNPVIKGLFP